MQRHFHKYRNCHLFNNLTLKISLGKKQFCILQGPSTMHKNHGRVKLRSVICSLIRVFSIKIIGVTQNVEVTSIRQ